jgi:hypothetical protein
MRVSFLPLSVAGLGVALCLASTASAAIIPIAPPPPAGSLTFSPESGSFTNEYTFSLASAADLSAFDTITLVPGSKFTSGVLELFNGTPAHPGTKVASEAITAATPASPPDATLVELLGAGNYYYQVAVVAKGPLANILAVSSIPESSTWAMMTLGFAGLGYAAFRRRGKSQIVGEPI